MHGGYVAGDPSEESRQAVAPQAWTGEDVIDNASPVGEITAIPRTSNPLLMPGTGEDVTDD